MPSILRRWRGGLRLVLLGGCTAVALAAAPGPRSVTTAAELAEAAEAELRGNILPFWLEHVPHPARDGFHGAVDETGRPVPGAGRGCLMTSRILWTFSAAYRVFEDDEYLAMARRAYEDLTRNFQDERHGGYFWSIEADGTPDRTNKHVYGQAFVLYGLAEYHRATRDPAVLAQAVALYRLIEAEAADHEHGGYYESFTRGWRRQWWARQTVLGPGAAKSQNTHLHLMEAYANLLRAWPDEGLRARQRALIEVILDQIVDPATNHLGLYFDADWSPRSATVSPGHDIEFAWLVTEAVSELGDAELWERVRPLAIRIAETTLNQAVEADGGISYEVGPEGVVDSVREWWVPAEAAVGFFNAYELSRDERFLEAALQQWTYIERHFIDRRHGEWRHSVRPGGTPIADRPKAGPWKAPYHNSRAALELLRRGRALTPDR